MPVTHSLLNGMQLVDWTEEIQNVDHQYGLINGMNLFSTKGVSQTAIVFDKSYNDTTLLPQVSRRSREATKGSGRKVETFSLPLAYFKHTDSITAEDIQGWRMPGTPDSEEALANVRAQKLADMRAQVEQTLEYMKLSAAKGICKTPDGATLANMFTEFGVTQDTVDFVLGTSTTDVDKKIAQVKRLIQTNLKTGGMISGIDLLVDESFYDKLISHPNIRDAYKFYQNTGAQRLRDEMSQYMSWGVVDHFEHRGVRFMTYDATFKLPGGTTEAAIATDEGHALPKGVRDLFRGYYGPSNKLEGVNSVGKEIFAYEYSDAKGEYIEMEAETAPLFFCTQPKVLVKVTTSN